MGDRQRTCGAGACRAEQKRRAQGAWSSRNPTYWTELRLDEQVAAVKAGKGAPPCNPPPSLLRQLPQDYIEAAVGVEGLVLVTWLVRRAGGLVNREVAPNGERMATVASHRQPTSICPFDLLQSVRQ